MPTQYIPAVVFQPDSYLGIQRGINLMAEAIRPTLGPLPRLVAIERTLRQRAPELLDSGAVIARRLIELPDRDADMGAMFLRHVVWRVQEQAGDGTATTAVLFQSVYNQGVRYLAAGGNPMRLRDYLYQGTQAILTQLNTMTIYFHGQEQLARLAEASCHDPSLARLLGEIFDIIGEYGRLEVQVGNTLQSSREYIEGMYWKSSLVSREMITDPKKARTDLENVAVLVTNLNIDTASQLIPVVEVTRQAKIPSLLVLANKLSDQAVAFLLANTKPGQFRAIAANTPGLGATQQGAALQDLVALTGGTLFLEAAGQRNFDRITLTDLGRARRAWADLHYVGIIGGKGNPRALRQHIAGVRAAYNQTKDPEQRQALQERLSKLISGSAILKIGGATNTEIKARKDKAEHACEAVRGAIREGVVPGGGIALLACRTGLQQMLDQATDTDERAAYGMLLQTLEAPFRTLMTNAGYDPSQALAQICQAEPGYGFDVLTGQVVEMVQAGIVDSALAQKTAVQSAITSAALALTTEVLVHHKNPKPPAMSGPGAH